MELLNNTRETTLQILKSRNDEAVRACEKLVKNEALTNIERIKILNETEKFFQDDIQRAEDHLEILSREKADWEGRIFELKKQIGKLRRLRRIRNTNEQQ